MAIIIPSKNIYEIDNPKIIDNIIDNVSVEKTVITPNNDYETPVYNEDIKIGVYNNAISDPNGKDKSTIVNLKSFPYQGGNFIYWYFCSHTEYNTYGKTQTITIKIPKLQNNSFVNKIYYGENDEGDNNIKYSLYGYKKSGEVSSSVSFDIGVGSVSNERIGDIVYSDPIYGENERFEIPKKEEFIYEGSFDNGLTSGTGSATSTAILYDSSTLLTAKPTDYIENGVEYYLLEFNVICGVRVVKMGGNGGNSPIALAGTYEEYVPEQIEITIYGNTIGINLTDGSVTYGSGNKPLSLSGNELLQDSAYYSKSFKILVNDIVANKVFFEPIGAVVNVGDTIVVRKTFTRRYIVKEENGSLYLTKENILDVYIKGKEYNATTPTIKQTQFLANNVLNEYAKGKETATLLCSISDYYDESGEKVIDTKTNKMSFRLHDEVIPYVYGADGKDKPMSKNQDGSAKVFEVVGSNIIYDGAVWQELTLQELDIT